MKISTMLVRMVFGALLVFSNTAAAALLNDEGVVLKSVLTEIKANFPMDEWGNPNAGIAWVDRKSNTLNVDLYSDPCNQLLPPRPGFMNCLAIPMKRASFVTPLQSQFNGTCDRVIYTGKTMDPSLGGSIEIQISDNRRFEDTCRSYLPMPAVSGFLKIRVDNTPDKEIRFAGVAVY